MRIQTLIFSFHALVVVMANLTVLTSHRVPKAIERYLRLTGFDHQWNLFNHVPEAEIISLNFRAQGELQSVFLAPTYQWPRGEIRRENYFLAGLLNPDLPAELKYYVRRWCEAKNLPPTETIRLEILKKVNGRISLATRPLACG